MVRQNNIIWVNLFMVENGLSFIMDFTNFKALSLKLTIRKLIDILYYNLHIIILDLAFIAFIVMNNYSIVLGDASHHKICLHLAQLNHFSFFFLFFFPYLNFKIFRIFFKEFYQLRNISEFVFYFLVIYIIMNIFDKFSYMHDFIYADNRHYNFYYFRRIYMNDILRHVMILWSSIIYSLILLDNHKILFDSYILSFVICCGLILVPAELFEFRYLTPCYITLLVIVHFLSAKWKDFYYLICNKYNVIWMIILNLVSLYIFIYFPFVNSYFDFESSRMMW